MDLYLDPTSQDVYYAPTAGNGYLAIHGDGDLYAVPGDPAPATMKIDIARRIGDGTAWESVQDGLVPVEGQVLQVVDHEGLSAGDTFYRASAYTAVDAEASSSISVGSESDGIWLSGGEGQSTKVHLVRAPSHRVVATRDREIKRYSGRERGVVVDGRQRSRIVEGSAFIHQSMLTPTLNVLEELAFADSPHLYRDAFGRRIYGALGEVPQAWEQSWRHGPEVTSRWAVTFRLEEVDH